jgi:PAS domain S-box-containing protein
MSDLVGASDATLFESAMDGMAVLDADGECVYANERQADIYGYETPEAILGTHWRSLYSDEQVGRFEATVCPTLEAEGEWRGRAVGRRRDGESFDQELSITRTAAGGLVCAVRDVTATTERERALDRQRTILESIRDGVYTLDPDGVITWVNQSAVDEFDGGYTRSDLVGAHVSTLLSEADIEQCLAIIDDLLAEDGPESARCEIALKTAYGDEIPCELNMTLLPFEDGEFQGTVGVVRDMTERKRREQHLSVLNRVLRHNLRNRMSVVMGHLDMLEERVGDEHRAHVETMRETAEEIVAVSEMASRMEEVIEGGGRHQETVDVVETITGSVDAFRERYPGASISVDVPAAKAVRADDRLRSVVDALVENAIEHTDREPVVTVRLQPPGEDGLVTIAVEDNGPGIPDSEIDVLDEAREGPLSHGSGLGLWYVRWYADGHGGEVEFDEAADRGSVVRLRLRAA